MAQFLKAVLNSDNQAQLSIIQEFLSAKTCPEFEEDVSSDCLDLFIKLERIEFCSESKIEQGELAMTWYDAPELSAGNLIAEVGGLPGLNITCFEIEDYADCSDDPELSMAGYVYRYSDTVKQKMEFKKAAMSLDKLLMDKLTEGLES